MIIKSKKMKNFIKCAGLLWSPENEVVHNKKHFTLQQGLNIANDKNLSLATIKNYKELHIATYQCWDLKLKGAWYADKKEDLFDKTKSLFLPAIGYCEPYSNTIIGQGIYALYWSSTKYNNTENGYYLGLYEDSNEPIISNNIDYKLAIRCVKYA